jgi:hypothetical protein
MYRAILLAIIRMSQMDAYMGSDFRLANVATVAGYCEAR